MRFSYNEVRKYQEKIASELKPLLSTLDDTLISARDGEDKLPVYLTKCRIKSVDAIYLKTKRKSYNSLKEITDYAGLRVLCLFEQDIFPVFEYILTTLPKKEYTLSVFKAYNWSGHKDFLSISKRIKKDHPDLDIKPGKKTSGYRSLHFIFAYKLASGIVYPFEIQLRTLLQDVWSELEHSLAYKNSKIHAHITKSFELLSEELNTKDALISHLRDIRDKEHLGQSYAIKKAGPVNYFGYDPELVPDLFKSGEYQDRFAIYIDNVSTLTRYNYSDAVFLESKRLYEVLTSKISKADRLNDIKLDYFDKMEGAFFNFWEEDYKGALDKYKSLLMNYDRHSILNFRMGEVYFVRGKDDDIVKALVKFDKSDSILENTANPSPTNHYRIKVKLAYIYWLLGGQYIDTTIRLIDEAKSIFENNQVEFNSSESFGPNERFNLINNIVSYYLEGYIVKRYGDYKKESQKHYKEAKKYVGSLEKELIKSSAPANWFDTVGWYYYKTFEKTGNIKYWERAIKYCKQIGDRVNYSTFGMTSANLHKNHIQEIMNAK